jgi:hypothetical protein
MVTQIKMAGARSYARGEASLWEREGGERDHEGGLEDLAVDEQQGRDQGQEVEGREQDLAASLGGGVRSADTNQGAVGEVEGEQDAGRDHVVEVSEGDEH